MSRVQNPNLVQAFQTNNFIETNTPAELLDRNDILVVSLTSVVIGISRAPLGDDQVQDLEVWAGVEELDGIAISSAETVPLEGDFSQVLPNGYEMIRDDSIDTVNAEAVLVEEGLGLLQHLFAGLHQR